MIYIELQTALKALRTQGYTLGASLQSSTYREEGIPQLRTCGSAKPARNRPIYRADGFSD